jgi:hypothetical protein
MLIISCHADTGFPSHALHDQGEGLLYGHLDNFAGVYAVMQAYFSGRWDQDFLRIELTYGEEVDFAGAYEVLDSLNPEDIVIVVDVTATPTSRDFVIEKCEDEELQEFFEASLEGMSYHLYDFCPDPVSDQDEVEVYRSKCRACFLGIPCFGGDYNEGKVYTYRRNLVAVAEALCRISENFGSFF